MDDSVMTVEEMRSQIRSWMVEHELRKKALDYDGALCVDGIEIEEDANGLLFPVRYHPEAFENGDTLRIPAFLESVLDSKEKRVYPYTTWRLNQNVYTTMNNLKRLVIEGDDTKIQNYAFMNSRYLEYVDMSVYKTVPIGVFRDCDRLKVADIRNVEVIGKNSFEGCISLKKIIISSKLKRVCGMAFNGITDELEIEVIDGFNKSLYINQNGNKLFYDLVRKCKKEYRKRNRK